MLIQIILHYSYITNHPTKNNPPSNNNTEKVGNNAWEMGLENGYVDVGTLCNWSELDKQRFHHRFFYGIELINYWFVQRLFAQTLLFYCLLFLWGGTGGVLTLGKILATQRTSDKKSTGLGHKNRIEPKRKEGDSLEKESLDQAVFLEHRRI